MTSDEQRRVQYEQDVVSVSRRSTFRMTAYVSSCGIPLMYHVVGFGRGNGRHSVRHGRSVV